MTLARTVLLISRSGPLRRYEMMLNLFTRGIFDNRATIITMILCPNNDNVFFFFNRIATALRVLGPRSGVTARTQPVRDDYYYYCGNN